MSQKGRRSGRIQIGTSGWHYSHWVGPFYPDSTPSRDFLGFYTRHFQTVEINNTFYHLPSPETLKDWQKQTPVNFLFACKGSRFITHMKKLKDPKESLNTFFDTIRILGNKLGPVLFQLPPRCKINAERLEAFLKAVPKPCRVAFEFRDESWFDESIYEVLKSHQAAFCLYNFSGRWSPEIVTADFVYIRLHGPGKPYQGSYDNRELRKWAKKCTKWSKEGKDVYCYFDNDENAYAAKNAMMLKELIEKS